MTKRWFATPAPGVATTTNVPRSDQRTSTLPPRTDGGSSGQAASTAYSWCTVGVAT
jgi:hypothetical protein